MSTHDPLSPRFLAARIDTLDRTVAHIKNKAETNWVGTVFAVLAFGLFIFAVVLAVFWGIALGISGPCQPELRYGVQVPAREPFWCPWIMTDRSK